MGAAVKASEQASAFSARGQSFLRLGNYQECKALCEEGLEKYPNDYDLLWLMARAMHATGENEQYFNYALAMLKSKGSDNELFQIANAFSEIVMQLSRDTELKGKLLAGLTPAASSPANILGYLAKKGMYNDLKAAASIARARKIRQPPAEKSTDELIYIEELDLSLLLDLKSLVDQSVYINGTWENTQLQFLSSLAPGADDEQAVFVDCGSYWGIYSLVMAGQPGVDKCYTFEADPHNFNQLAAQLFLNPGRARKIQAFNVPVGTEGAAVRLSGAFNSLSNRGGASVRIGEGAGTVQSRSLDKLLGISGRKLIIKIDLEGFEMACLEGAVRTLSENKCIVQIELYDVYGNVMDAVAMLESLGFRKINQISVDWYFMNF
jgi:FkbM family methyltransferase